MDIPAFKQLIFDYYSARARSFPWRETGDPYAIAVSEIMLQQTQAERVVTKYLAFLEALPNWQALATVSNQELFTLWQGLGYNRRALALKRMAETLVTEYAAVLPQDRDSLQALPGIGPYTAGAILAFAFNQPVTFIETNIRRVFLHHFFADAEAVSDKELMPLIEKSLDRTNPREWYYALMDYGAELGRTLPNPNHRSKHYTKQTAFQGSNRQVRGAVLRFLTEQGRVSRKTVEQKLDYSPERIDRSLEQLVTEGFLVADGDTISIYSH